MRVKDIDGREVRIHNPRSGKEAEVIFMPEKVLHRLKAYIPKVESRLRGSGTCGLDIQMMYAIS